MNQDIKFNLKQIPKLPVLREDICPKNAVDKVMDALIAEYPYDLEKLSWYISGMGTGVYLEMGYIMGSVASEYRERYGFPGNTEYGTDEFYNTHMFYMQMACEILRRMRKAYGYSDEYPVLGKPLAPSRHGPFPELVHCEVHSSTKAAGFTQEVIDKVLTQYYKDYPEWWYIRAEIARRELVPYFNAPAGIREYLKSLLPEGFTTPQIEHYSKEYPSLVLGEIHSNVGGELERRLQIMCEINLG